MFLLWRSQKISGRIAPMFAPTKIVEYSVTLQHPVLARTDSVEFSVLRSLHSLKSDGPGVQTLLEPQTADLAGLWSFEPHGHKVCISMLLSESRVGINSASYVPGGAIPLRQNLRGRQSGRSGAEHGLNNGRPKTQSHQSLRKSTLWTRCHKFRRILC